MGALISRQNAAIEEVDIVSNHAYKYPPKSGNYFGNHFIMGGERFETPQPEAYLFGENGDLNFLGSRPTPFPYPPPQANEPTKTLKSLVNIRKESLRLVRVVGSGKGVEGDAPAKSAAFNIEFTFDCDARTAITIYYFATEEFTPNGVVYCPKDPSLTSETYMYERGTNQLFSQPTHVFEPGHYTDDELAYGADKEVMPVAIHCVTAHQPGSDDQKQSHTSIAVVERHSDGTYVLKALKQRLYVDGLCYLLQEIYGIENKASDICKVTSDGEETEDGGSECVICMCDVRDTLILPCRHLCLCNSCADSLRYQANNCPICRAPFRALLQIRALQKSPSANTNAQPHQENSDGIPPGFEAVSLIEALNGPSLGRSGGGGVSVSAAANLVVALETGAAENTAAAQLAAEALNRSTTADKQPECIPTSVKLPPEADVGGGEEVRMSVLLAREGSQDSAGSKSKGRSSRGQGGDRTPRDTVRVINEIAPTQDETQDEDSEAEKLSPLLDAEKKKKSCSLPAPRSPSRSHALADDDHHVPHTSGLTAVGGPGDESEDYYTPEDPATTILSPLHCDDKDPGERSCVEVGGARVCWRGGGDGLSLPGTPLSTASHRSSGDSYSSGGSTRLLLSTHDKTTVA